MADIEDLLDDQMVDRGARIGSALGSLVAGAGHDAGEEEHGEHEASY